MVNRRTARFASWSGILGIVIPSIGVVVYPIWWFPAASSSGEFVAHWVAAHHVQLQIMMVFYTVGVSLWLAFGAGVWSLLKNELEPTALEPVAFGAGLVALIALLLAGFTAFDLLIYRPRPAADASMLYDLAFGLLAMSGMPTALCTGAFAMAIYRSEMLPRWTAHLALATAVAHVLLLGTMITTTAPLGLEDFGITGVPAFLWAWILLVALRLARAPKRQPATE